MNPKINSSTLQQGVVDIINNSSNFNEKNIFEDTKNNIQYDIYIHHYDTPYSAQETLAFYMDGDESNIKTNGTIHYGATKCFRPRDMRYLGVAEQCFGSVFVQYECYIVEINYYYIRSCVESYIGALFAPESVYREEIDLATIIMDNQVTVSKNKAGDGSMSYPKTE